MPERPKRPHDKQIDCEDCKTAFAFTAAEQKFYLEKGFTNEPKRCKACRAARKSIVAGGHGRRPQGLSRDGRFPAGQRGEAAAPLFKADFGPVATPSPHRGKRQGGHGERTHGKAQPGRHVPVRRDPTWRFQGYQGRRTRQPDGQQRGPGGWLDQKSGGRGGPRHDARQRSPALGGAYRMNIGAALWKPSPGPRGGSHADGPSKTRRYEAVCTDCGAETQVPFRPNGVSPVYCRTCLPRHKARRARPSPRRGDAARGA